MKLLLKIKPVEPNVHSSKIWQFPVQIHSER